MLNRTNRLSPLSYASVNGTKAVMEEPMNKLIAQCFGFLLALFHALVIVILLYVWLDEDASGLWISTGVVPDDYTTKSVYLALAFGAYVVAAGTLSTLVSIHERLCELCERGGLAQD